MKLPLDLRFLDIAHSDALESTVRVDVTIPGQELAINRAHADDVYVAVRDAFDAAQRKLEDAIRTRRDQQHRPRAA